ncbi:MAG: ankyrin repeat-containing domain protein [Benjaminiella poitrasii]|nr:MAG: ankyrin repeat-containing domain protein [Benjaminiella poitrasii]
MNSIDEEEYYTNLTLPPLPPLSPGKNKFQKKKSTLYRFKKYDEVQAEKFLRDLITEVECIELQNRLKQAMDNIVLSFTEKHDSLIDALDGLEQAKTELEHRLHLQSQHYERSLKEVQLFYKTQYENHSNFMFQHQSSRRSTSSSILLPSNASCISGKSYRSSSSAHSSSCSSSIRNSFSHLVDEIIDPIILHEHRSLTEDERLSSPPSEIDFYSALSDSDTSTPALMNTPKDNRTIDTPLASSTTNDNQLTIHNEIGSIKSHFENNSESTIIPASEGNEKDVALTFACGDGFWNTIARGKSNKAEVDTLVSNYLRRGGNPNVAKNSETVRNVKEGYGLIHALIAIKNTSALQKVIAAGANTSAIPLTTKKEDRITPLVLAAKLGYMNGVRLLIEKSGSKLWMHDRGPYGENALHAAVQGGSDEIAGYLLRISDNFLLDQTDINGMSKVIVSVYCFERKTFNIFNVGATPLHYACITGKTRLLTLFIRDCEAQSDPKDNKGETPLHYAVRNRKLKAVIKLVGELGVYPNPYIAKQVLTPLDLAKSGGLKAITEYLKSVGAKTTKEMEKSNRSSNNSQIVYSSNSSTFSGDSNTSCDNMNHGSTSSMGGGVRQFLHTKTSQILRGTFDL